MRSPKLATYFAIVLALLSILVISCGGIVVTIDEVCPLGQIECDGACKDILHDRENCGDCRNICRQSEVCSRGACAPVCGGGLTYCDGHCVNVRSDPDNCGGCGVACASQQVCNLGSCELTCESGLTRCGNSCVDLQSDPSHCGDCHTACPAGQVCNVGSCELTCGAGLTECGDGCVDLSSDPSHCGGCDVACGQGQVCTLGSCAASCGADLTMCGTSCVNTQTNTSHCGACHNACAAGQVCSAGQCTTSCGGTTPTLCGTSCVNTQTNTSHCGACHNACGAGQVCSAGQCTTSCGGTTPTLCGTSCVNTQTNTSHCGACHNACGAGQVCTGGVCTFSPRRCDPSNSPACTVAHELPIPTHYDSTQLGYRFMASDAADLYDTSPFPSNYVAGSCYRVYKHGRLPDSGSYIASNFSKEQVSNTDARQWANDTCNAAGVPVRHLRPPNPSGSAHPGAGPQSDVCELQVIHGLVIDGSLATVVLPPGWSATAPAGYYPIVFYGFYDLNGNTFSDNGRFLARIVAESSLGGRRGVIGVLWNGGGGDGTLTMHPRALDQFEAVIDNVSSVYRGNRHWIVTFGGSRGGYTSLAMASNPRGANYRVVMAAAVAPPTWVGEFIHSNNTTYPGMIYVVPGIVGFKDAWMPGWTYPACAGRPHLTGLTAAEAALYILTGTRHRETANQQNSPRSATYLNGLQSAGTQVYLEITEHDTFISYLHQLDYAVSLVNRSIPVALRFLIRGGHVGLPGPVHGHAMLDAVASAVTMLSAPGLNLSGPVPSLVSPSIEYYRYNRSTRRMEPFTPVTNMGIPFSIEIPYKAFAGTDLYVKVIGAPGTQYELTVTPQGSDPIMYPSVIGDSLQESFPIPLQADHPQLTYQWSARVLGPTGTWINIPTTSTPSGAACTTTVETNVPAVGNYEAYLQVVGPQPPSLLDGTELLTSWGLSQY